MNENKKYNNELDFLNEEVQKIEKNELLYPSLEIEQLNSDNKIFILNGQFGSGKSTIIKSIPESNTKIITISLLEDDLKHFKFNIYNKIKKHNWWLGVSFLPIILFCIALYFNLKYQNNTTKIWFEFFSILLTSWLSTWFFWLLFNLKILKYLLKYNEVNQKYSLYDIDNKIVKKLMKNNILIIIEDIDRLPENKITEFISLLNSLILKFMDNKNKYKLKVKKKIQSKIILSMDLNLISKENISLLEKTNYLIVDTMIHSNLYLYNWIKGKMKNLNYFNNRTKELLELLPWNLTIRKFKYIIKKSINDLKFYEESKFLSLIYKECITFNFFLLKNLIIFGFLKEDILNKKIRYLFFKKEELKNINESKSREDILIKYNDFYFKDIEEFLQQALIDNIYLQIIGNVNNPMKLDYFNLYKSGNELNYSSYNNKINRFLISIETLYQGKKIKGIEIISTSLKKELLNLNSEFANWDSIFQGLILSTKSEFSQTKIENNIGNFINMLLKDKEKHSGIDSYLCKKFESYLNINNSVSFSDQILYQKLGIIYNKENYNEYFEKIVNMKKPFYISWAIINSNNELKNILTKSSSLDLIKNFWLCITKLIFKMIHNDLIAFIKDYEIFCSIINDEPFKTFKKELDEIFISNSLGAFFNSIVELFYLDVNTWDQDYYSKICNIINNEIKQIPLTSRTFYNSGNSNYLLWPWHLVTENYYWLVSNYKKKNISIEKMKYIYESTKSNLKNVMEEYQVPLKEKLNSLIKELELNFEIIE